MYIENWKNLLKNHSPLTASLWKHPIVSEDFVSHLSIVYYHYWLQLALPIVGPNHQTKMEGQNVMMDRFAFELEELDYKKL